jgi:two-component system phosphate regulon sensor histidine kinase PhoR
MPSGTIFAVDGAPHDRSQLGVLPIEQGCTGSDGRWRDRLAFDVHLPDHLPERDALVQAEQHAVSHMINDLASNAIKYTAQSGVEVRAETAPEALSVVVRDSDLSIPSEGSPHIFDWFYRIPQPEYLKEDGTGLGLVIVKKIVDRHQGVIQVETAVGIGSTSRVTMPR